MSAEKAPSNHSNSSDSEEEENIPLFNTEAEADIGRKMSLELYNKGEYDAALPLHVGVLEYHIKAYGELDAKCGLPYLDYGNTLLACVQSQDAEAAMVGGDANDEDLETCFMNLDAARVCFEKAEAKDADDELTQYRLAEVHDCLAQVLLEQDNATGAVGEFEHVLMILNGMKNKNHKRVIGVLYSLANTLLGEQSYEEAVKRFEETLATIDAAPKDQNVDASLREEVVSFLEEAKEGVKKPDEMENIKEGIREMFPDEKSQVPDPEEFEKQQKPANEFMVPLPMEFTGASKSVPLSLMTPIVPDEGHSNSISIFAFQNLSGDNSQTGGASKGLSGGPVNIKVAVKKKEKPAAPAAAKDQALPEKRVRKE